MSPKTILALCASALFVQFISCQCIGSAVNPGLIGYGSGLGYGNNLARAELAGLGGCGYGLAGPAISTSGGGLAVSSSSPIAPSGITVISENAIEGLVDVVGQLPVLATVALEGGLPSAGAAGVTYSCGNGNIGISSESLAASGLAGGIVGAELAGLNAGIDLANAGLNGAGLIGLIGINGINGLNGINGVNGVRGCGCGIF